MKTGGITAEDRIVGLDAVRAAAALGVVVLHASAPYLVHPMPGLEWATRDVPHASIDALFWAIELFIMPVFLVMAGFLALPVWRRRGDGAFLRERGRRLLLPLLLGIVTILPLGFYVWMLGWVAEGMIRPRVMRSLKFPPGVGDHLFGLSHLWFLQYLFLYCAASVLALRLVRWLRIAGAAQGAGSQRGANAERRASSELGAIAGGWVPGRRLPWVILALLGVLTLWVAPQVVLGFQHGFLPFPSKWLYSGTFFVGGLLLAAEDPRLEALRRRGPARLALGLLLTGIGVVLGTWHLRGTMPPWLLPGTAAVIVGSAWGMSLGVIGSAVRWLHRPRPIIGYLAAASFWIYLVHHPLVAMFHIHLRMQAPEWSPLAKLALATTGTLVLCAVSFEAAVRRTWLGRLLGVPSGKAPGDRASSDRRPAGQERGGPQRPTEGGARAA